MIEQIWGLLPGIRGELLAVSGPSVPAALTRPTHNLSNLDPKGLYFGQVRLSLEYFDNCQFAQGLTDQSFYLIKNCFSPVGVFHR